jgi:uncharacterized phage protein (TIGR02220 family)
MARIRMIKPEFWDDEKLSSISRDARLTFIGMWNNSDDYAVVKGHASWLKNNIFPYDDIKLSEFQKWLLELENIKVILPFEHSGEKYYYIKNFQKHQTINRPSQVKNPQPQDNIIDDSLNTHGVVTDEIKLNEVESKLNKVEVESKDPPAVSIPYKEIIDYLNQQTGKHFEYTSKETQAKIKARWGINGKQRTLQDFITVIDNKCTQWLTDEKMASFLRPETLFGIKFESYLNEIVHPLTGKVGANTIKTIKVLENWRPPV